MTAARDALAARVEAHLPDPSVVAPRRMFGAHAFMVNGKLAVGAGPEGDLLVRVASERVDELLARPGAQQAGMGDRMMGRGWITVDPEHAADDDELAFWVAAALEHNATATA